MKPLLLAALSVFALSAQTPPCGARPDRNSMLVSTAWLADHLKDPNLVILAIGPQNAYDAGHIPGALFLDRTTIAVDQPLTTELRPAPQLKAAFEKLGVGNNSRIVVYHMANGITAATRVFLTLDSLGLGARTAILDGGFNLWQKESRPTSTGIRTPAPSKLDVCPQEVTVDAAYVSAHIKQPGVQIIDARTANFYTGETIPQGQRAGHIPGAANLPFNSLLDSDGKLKSPDALKEMLTAAGVKPGTRPVSYCHIGMQATVVYFAARSLGLDPRLYDGSWEDWSQRTDLPVEK